VSDELKVLLRALSALTPEEFSR